MHNDQPKPSLRCNTNVLSGWKGLLEIWGLEVMAECVRAGTHLQSWREKIPDCRSSDVDYVDGNQFNTKESTR